MTPTQNDDKPWVLIVDDSRVVRRTILNTLGSGFHVLEAGDGAAAWRMLSQNSRIEVVISDIQMPEMDGYSLICKVRAMEDPALRDLPIIVITSAEDEVTRERAYACGASDFILKPFHAEQLLSCVRNQIAEYRTHAAQTVTTGAPPPAPAKPAPEVIPITLGSGGPATVETALEHFDAGVNILQGQKTAAIAPHALSLIVRLLPLLKYCDAKFNLGLEREIARIQERVTAARAAGDSSQQTMN